MTDPRILGLLAELRTRLEELYSPRLKGVYLFGSYARGDADDESDVDVLIVLDKVERPSAEIDRTSTIISELSLKHDLSLSRVIVPEDRWDRSEDLFFRNVRDEAVPA